VAQFDPDQRIAEIKKVLISFVEHGDKPGVLEGRGDVTSFLQTLRDFAGSVDKGSLKRPWWMDDG
jgi:hypothetical protein